MVKESMKNCELKCQLMVVKYVKKCVELKVIIVNLNFFVEECWNVQVVLQK